uniref:Retrovirus-related Pol polyprotein from transposon TNT 1-94 n=2 Tax=Cajanus cajan TaxID=3821 RepID=A0A151TJU0_CAJCA|nr:Retrovirus-related Pol polyprotein from transposon TNT 1-94 [Cajanus cajan]
MLFLMGLNEGYSHIRGKILLMNPIPPIEKVFSLVLQEEKQQELGIPTNSNDTPTAFAYKSGNDAKSRTNNPTKERPKCEYCGKLCHIKDKCFKLHGYPTHLKQGNSNTNVNQVSNKSAKAFQFTADQYHQILSLLQNQPSSNCIESNPIVNGLLLSIRLSFNSIPSTKWILDSGASTHVAFYLSLFKTYKIIKNFHVTLLNQSHIPVCGIGTVYLDQDIVLKDVLYVPQFQYNLFSINCLVKHNSLSLLFVSNKFILVKYLPDGTVDRLKARLVAKGYTQQPGIDFADSFSLVAKLTKVRTLLVVAAVKGWHLQQLDINNAFLNGYLHEDLYMSLPPGHPSKDSNLACKLNKSLYGLRQASRQWFNKFSSTLKAHGFTQSMNDYSLFTCGNDSNLVTLIVYVDDIIVAGPNATRIHQVQTTLQKIFKLKVLGDLKYFLGLEISRSSKGINLCQRKYVLQLLSDTGCLASKPTSLPMDPNNNLNAEIGDLLADPSLYKRLIGRLLYLTISIPDITYVVHKLSQFMQSPTNIHLKFVHHLLQYLKGTPG